MKKNIWQMTLEKHFEMLVNLVLLDDKSVDNAKIKAAERNHCSNIKLLTYIKILEILFFLKCHLYGHLGSDLTLFLNKLQNRLNKNEFEILKFINKQLLLKEIPFLSPDRIEEYREKGFTFEELVANLSYRKIENNGVVSFQK